MMIKKTLHKLKETIDETLEVTKDSTQEMFHLPIKTKKIAITGLSRSGKTVFITSLIDQLLHQHKITKITKKYKTFKATLKPPKPTMKRFDYYHFSKNIKSNYTWPKGTDDITSTLLEFESKGNFSFLGNSKFRLELIDYPGEWILDIALLGTSYEEWSNNTIEWMKNLDEPLAKEYLDLLKDLDDTSEPYKYEIKLHLKYASMLRYLKDNHYSNLTPGRFLMPSDLKDDPILLFAPIPKSNSTLYQAFQTRYQSYLKDIVTKIQLEHFRGFDKQIVLIDVIEALQNGYKCYKDMKTGLENMLSIYSHKNKNFISQLFQPSINNVTFVATKADLVASSQHNNYLALLNEMVEEIRKDLDIKHIQTNSQVIASIQCTQTVMCKHNGKTLSCVRGIDANTQKTVEIYPGEMPFSFPSIEHWDTEAYAFEQFLPPQKKYKENEPFDHIHMDKLIELVLGDLL